VTALWSAGVTSAELIDRLQRLERRDFWDPAPGLGLLRGRRFAALLEELLPVRTFAECRIPVALSVFDVATRATRVLDSGPLAPAIQASCTVPIMFHPVRHQGRALLDGGILDRPGLAGVPAGERVFYHHLSSRWLGYGVPRRAGMIALEIEALPRADPFRMQHGRRAIELASLHMRRALGQPAAAHMHGRGV
jgi:NTE family protein